MIYPVTDIITWAKFCQAYSLSDEEKTKAFKGKAIDKNLDVLLRMERMSLEWQYSQNPSATDIIYTISGYVFSLCFPYLLRAQQSTGGGSPVVPPVVPSAGTTIFPLFKTASDFQPDNISYNNPDIVGKNLMVFVLGFNSEWQFAPTFFVNTVTGIQIVFPGFDINNYQGIIIEQYNP